MPKPFELLDHNNVGFKVDTSQWPVAVISVYGEPSFDQTTSLCDYCLNELLQPGHRYAHVVDLTKAGTRGTEFRAAQDPWVDAHQDRIKECLICWVMVVSNPIIRTMVRAYFIFRPAPCPLHICAKLEDGLEFAHQQIQETIANAS